jgi:2-dehydropantoate 2-reductase
MEAAMPKIRQVAILGAGAMGAFYAARFFSAPGFSTVFVAGGERGHRLRTQGMIVNEVPCSVPVADPAVAKVPADLVIVALKHHQLACALPALRHLVGDHTVILSVMNGLDSEAIIGGRYGMDKVLYSIAVGIDAVRDGSGVTVANPGKLVFGAAGNSRVDPRVRRVQAALDRAGLTWETPGDMVRMLWWKFMINVGVNQASAVLRAPYGVFQRSPHARTVLAALMGEVLALAAAERVDLTAMDLERWDGILHSLSPSGKTSMLQDIEAQRKTEVEIFAGKVVELGRRHGIPTPVNGLMLNLIRTLEDDEFRAGR